MRKAISSPNAAPAKGAYSQAILSAGHYLHISALGPFDPEDGRITAKTFAEQVKRTYANMEAVLNAANASLENVVQVTVYIPDWVYLNELNTIHAKIFKKPYPARTPVKMDIPFGLFMADAVALLD